MTVRTTYITTDKYISAPQVRSTRFVSLVRMFDAQQLAVISSYLCCCIAIFHDDTLLGNTIWSLFLKKLALTAKYETIEL
jgi:hypothetical protein